MNQVNHCDLATIDLIRRWIKYPKLSLERCRLRKEPDK